VGDVLAGLGGLLVGLAGVVSAVASARSARQAKRRADEVVQMTAIGTLEALRSEIDGVVDAYRQAVTRHAEERDGIEAALDRERLRAEGAEGQVFHLRAQMAGLRMDLAAARAEISELGSRLDTFMHDRSAWEDHR
jgi:chromosome segregation ATPase